MDALREVAGGLVGRLVFTGGGEHLVRIEAPVSADGRLVFGRVDPTTLEGLEPYMFALRADMIERLAPFAQP